MPIDDDDGLHVPNSNVNVDTPGFVIANGDGSLYRLNVTGEAINNIESGADYESDGDYEKILVDDICDIVFDVFNEINEEYQKEYMKVIDKMVKNY